MTKTKKKTKKKMKKKKLKQKEKKKFKTKLKTKTKKSKSTSIPSWLFLLIYELHSQQFKHVKFFTKLIHTNLVVFHLLNLSSTFVTLQILLKWLRKVHRLLEDLKQ